MKNLFIKNLVSIQFHDHNSQKDLLCIKGYRIHPVTGRPIGQPRIRIVYGNRPLSPTEIITKLGNKIKSITFNFSRANGSALLLENFCKKLTELEHDFEIIQ